MIDTSLNALVGYLSLRAQWQSAADSWDSCCFGREGR